MLNQVPLLQLLLATLRERSVFPARDGALRRSRPDDGYTTEAIIATALLAGVAITAFTAITVKILDKVGVIELG